MRRSLADARIIITGAFTAASGGSLHWLLRGARLLLAARRGELIAELCEACRRAGGTAEFLAGDVTEPRYRQAIVERAVELYSALDGLVNNAGVSAHGSFATSDETTLRRIMEVNFFAATELTRTALPFLRQGKQPAIVNIGSILGHRGVPLNSEYVASKFALRGWSESLRAELASQGIDVLLVSPGTTETELLDHLLAKHGKLPWGKAKALSAAAVAEQTVRALERGRREIFPNWRGRALVVANRLFPGLVDRAIDRIARRALPTNRESEAPADP